jgi:hypothetical protein
VVEEPHGLRGQPPAKHDETSCCDAGDQGDDNYTRDKPALKSGEITGDFLERITIERMKVIREERNRRFL